MARHLVYFIHADPVVRPKYAAALAALGEVDIKILFAGAFSSSYVSLAASLRDRDGRHLPNLRAKHPPPRPIGDYATVSLITFSAGYAFARALMSHAEDRRELSAYVAIDSIHAGFGPRGIDGGQLAGFVEYARLAKAGAAVFWLGHSDVQTPQPPHPKAFASTTQAAAEIVKLAAGTGGNFSVRAYDVRADAMKEHSAALTEWGPGFVAEALVPWLSSRAPTETPTDTPEWQDSAIALGMRTVLFSRREMERGIQEEPLGSKTGPRVREYFASCERDGRMLGLTSGDWCAAGACFAATRALRAGEALPHRYRAAGIELQRDLVAAGAWRPLASVLDGAFMPEPGDLVILSRGTESWMRHVCRVVDVDLAARTITTIGANEEDGWRITRRALVAPILGFGEYPALAARPVVEVQPDPTLATELTGLTPDDLGRAVTEEDSPGTTGPRPPVELLDDARRTKAQRYNAAVAGHLWRQVDLAEDRLRTVRVDSAAFAEIVAAIQKSAGLGVDGKLGPDTLRVLAARRVVSGSSGGEVPKAETPLSEVELARILQEGHAVVHGAPPPDARLACAWAHCALEHGRGKAVYCNNLGNISGFGKWPGSYYVIRVPERVNRETNEWRVIAMKFRAHADPVVGAADYWRLLSNRYAAAVALFDAGNADGAARTLSELGYYTAHVDPYARSMRLLYQEFTTRVRGHLPPASVAGARAAAPSPSPSEAPPALEDSQRVYLEGLVALSVETIVGDGG